MASYEELYNMIANESVKGAVGRTALKAIDSTSKLPEKYKTLKDKVKDKVQEKETDNAIKSVTKKAIKATAKGAKSVTDTASAAVVNGMDKSSEMIAKTVTAPEKHKIQKELKNDPAKLKEKLSQMEDKIKNVKQKVMTGQVAVSSLIAIGPVDMALKAMIANGSSVTKNKMASKALINGMLLAPMLAKKLADVATKKITGKEADKEYSSISSKVLNTLGEWARSDLDTPSISVNESVMFDDIDYMFMECVYESLNLGEISADMAKELLTTNTSNDVFMTVLECGLNNILDDNDFDYLMDVVAN